MYFVLFFTIGYVLIRGRNSRRSRLLSLSSCTVLSLHCVRFLRTADNIAITIKRTGGVFSRLLLSCNYIELYVLKISSVPLNHSVRQADYVFNNALFQLKYMYFLALLFSCCLYFAKQHLPRNGSFQSEKASLIYGAASGFQRFVLSKPVRQLRSCHLFIVGIRQENFRAFS